MEIKENQQNNHQYVGDIKDNCDELDISFPNDSLDEMLNFENKLAIPDQRFKLVSIIIIFPFSPTLSIIPFKY